MDKFYVVDELQNEFKNPVDINQFDTVSSNICIYGNFQENRDKRQYH